jgi:hypothetical protein
VSVSSTSLTAVGPPVPLPLAPAGPWPGNEAPITCCRRQQQTEKDGTVEVSKQYVSKASTTRQLASDKNAAKGFDGCRQYLRCQELPAAGGRQAIVGRRVRRRLRPRRPGPGRAGAARGVHGVELTGGVHTGLRELLSGFVGQCGVGEWERERRG